ncbi:MAG: hypothetical protein FJ290_27935 [Planctomycetes bacterium]|nr:hypothetical protein [Planctomycetota bacterium]
MRTPPPEAMILPVPRAPVKSPSGPGWEPEPRVELRPPNSFQRFGSLGLNSFQRFGGALTGDKTA